MRNETQNTLISYLLSKDFADILVRPNFAKHPKRDHTIYTQHEIDVGFEWPIADCENDVADDDPICEDPGTVSATPSSILSPNNLIISSFVMELDSKLAFVFIEASESFVEFIAAAFATAVAATTVDDELCEVSGNFIFNSLSIFARIL